MSSISDLIKRRKIEKYIDQVVSLARTRQPTVPPQDETGREIEKTNVSGLARDLIESIQRAKEAIEGARIDVFESNKTDQNFLTYAQLVKDAKENSVQRLVVKSGVVTQNISPTKIKFYENKVYEGTNDPRAPLYRDLTNMSLEMDFLDIITRRFWEPLIQGTSSEAPDENDRLTRYLLLGQSRYVTLIETQANRIKDARIERVADCFARSIAHQIVGRVESGDFREVVINIDNVIRTLRKIRALLSIAQVDLKQIFGKFQDVLQSVVTMNLQALGRHTINNQVSVFINSARQEIIDFTSELGVLNQASKCFDTGLFKEVLDNSLLGLLRKVEDQSVLNNSAYVQAEEARKLVLSNSHKNSKIKQFKRSIDRIISILSTLRGTISRADYYQAVGRDVIIKTVKDAINDIVS